ncbi:MAG: hypothetical protein QME68_04920 [Elusimicrobiota bacterium]|nr:hypothetical protein [Elusimicrobiota bacterium]
MVFLHHSMKLGLSLIFTFMFYWFFPVPSNNVIAIIIVVMFFYIVMGVSGIITNCIFYFFTKPKYLKEINEITEKGIPENINVVFFRPIFAKTFQEMQSLLNSMKQDILNCQEKAKNLKFIVIDNTRDEHVKAATRNAIKKMQQEFGADVVFYFHRNVKCDFFKKVGILFDAILLLYEGKTRPVIYTDEKWTQWSKGLRNPQLPLWDTILGDVSSLGIEGTIEEILSGKDVKINPDKRIKAIFVSDADNVWPKGEVRKVIAKMLHPENKDIVIYQPLIEISNPDENLFINMNHFAREATRYDSITKWRIYGFSPFYGKGAMNVENYVHKIIKSEWLHPGKAASHDFQESLGGNSVLLEDVKIMEKTFSNKVAELKRFAQWQWGDLETVRQYLFKKFTPGRKSHLYTLFRALIGNTIFSLWLILLVAVLSYFPSDYRPASKCFVFIVYLGLLAVAGFIISDIIVPIFNMAKKRLIFSTMKPCEVISRGLAHSFFSILISPLDFVYQPMAFIKNFYRQLKGQPFVWITGAMGEIETAGMSLFKIYKSLWLSTMVGIILLILELVCFLPAPAKVVLLPYMVSFLLGPWTIWFTSKVRWSHE